MDAIVGRQTEAVVAAADLKQTKLQVVVSSYSIRRLPRRGCWSILTVFLFWFSQHSNNVDFTIHRLKLPLLHPETIVEGCLYLNVNGLLWSESVMGYYGARA